MDPKAVAAGSVRFGVFELDRETGELRRRGVPVKLQEQPFKVLARLVEIPGKLVTREELREELWPGDTYGAFDTAINTAINKIRQALDDSAAHPRYVETVPKRGYRFVAAIENGEPTRYKIKTQVLAASALLAIAAAGASWRLASTNAEMPDPSSPVPLTTYLGLEVDPSLSPDGQKAAFAWTGEQGDSFDIYVKLIGSDAPPQRLTSGPGMRRAPLWSPDGAQIAFVDFPDGGSAMLSIVAIPSLGGPRRKIAEGRFFPQKGSWSPDGRWIAWGEIPECGEPAGIVLVSVETGERRVLTSGPADAKPFENRPGPGCVEAVRSGVHFSGLLPTTNADRDPAFSSDGRSIVFTREQPLRADLYRLDLDDDARPLGQPVRLTPEEFGVRWPRSPVWSPSGRDVIFEALHFGMRPALWKVESSKGGMPQRLPWGENGRRPSVARSTGRLAYVHDTTSVNIWRASLDDSSHQDGREKFLSSTHMDYAPQYSPDGTRVAFVSDRSGAHEIWVGGANGESARRMTSFGSGVTGSPRWSPDSRSIAFDSNARSGVFDIYVMDAESGIVQRRTSGLWSSITPSWSPDGNWLYYCVQHPEGDQVWVLPADPADERDPSPVVPKGGAVPQPSPDGRWIYHWPLGAPLRGSPLSRTFLDGGRTEVILPSVVRRNFVPWDDGIYFIPALENGQASYGLHFLDFATGETKRVLDLGVNLVRIGLSISPDRKHVLYAPWEAVGSDLMLVENFH